MWIPSYVAHFYEDRGCDFFRLGNAKTLDEAWNLAQEEGRRRKALGINVISICVQFATEVRSGGLEI